jgi:hypothetical protein
MYNSSGKTLRVSDGIGWQGRLIALRFVLIAGITVGLIDHANANCDPEDPCCGNSCDWCPVETVTVFFSECGDDYGAKFEYVYDISSFNNPFWWYEEDPPTLFPKVCCPNCTADWTYQPVQMEWDPNYLLKEVAGDRNDLDNGPPVIVLWPCLQGAAYTFWIGPGEAYTRTCSYAHSYLIAVDGSSVTTTNNGPTSSATTRCSW